MFKHIVGNSCYISEIWEIERFQTAKVTLGSRNVIGIGAI